MPRLAKTDTSATVTLNDIENSIQDIESLLEGRLDGDNMFSSGDGVAYIPEEKINGVPTSTNHITGDKFIARTVDAGDTVQDLIHTPLVQRMENTRLFRTLNGKTAFVLNKETTGTASNNVVRRKNISPVDDPANVIGGDAGDVIDESNFSRFLALEKDHKIYISKSPEYKIVTYADLLNWSDTYGDKQGLIEPGSTYNVVNFEDKNKWTNTAEAPDLSNQNSGPLFVKTWDMQHTVGDDWEADAVYPHVTFERETANTIVFNCSLYILADFNSEDFVTATINVDVLTRRML